MVNKVNRLLDFGNGFGIPLPFFTPREGDDLYSLQKEGEPENLIWAKSDLKLDFRFTEFLDCKNFHRDLNIQARLAEQVLVQNNTLWTGLGYTPQRLVLGLSSGVPGIYDVPENDNTNFSQSLNRIKAGINKSQVIQPHSTLGGSFPYELGDSVHFLGPKGRIGLGCITDIYGGEYKIVHRNESIFQTWHKNIQIKVWPLFKNTLISDQFRYFFF